MKILNINNLDPAEIEDVLRFCQHMISEDKGAFLVPMNPIKVIKARKHPDFQDIINNADCVFPDAWGLKFAASFLHGENIPVTPGYKVMFSLLSQAEKLNKTVYLLGSTEQVLKVAINRLHEHYPKLTIAGSHNGFFSPSEEKRIFHTIASLEPDYIFVAMGEYKQEKVISKLKLAYPQAIFMGVGGSLDLIAGKQPRPPTWISRNHLEWLYRLIRQPFRAPRFKALPIFVFLLYVEKLKRLKK